MSLVVFILVVLIALGYFAKTLYDRFQLLQAATPVNRFDRISDRINDLLVYGFGQKKFVTGEQPAGWMHIVIFWGFVILGLQITTMFGRVFSDHFFVPGFSPGLLGGPFFLLRDLLEISVLGVVGLALYRWLVEHPQRLFGFRPAEDRLAGQSHWEAILILSFISTIMLTGLLYDGGRLVALAGDPITEAERPWQPIARSFAGVLGLFGTGVALFVRNVAWWLRNV